MKSNGSKHEPARCTRFFHKIKPEYARNAITENIANGTITKEDGRFIRDYIAELKATSKIRMIGSINFVRNCNHWDVRLGGVSSFPPCFFLMVRTDSEESPWVWAASGRSRKGIISAGILHEGFSSFGRVERTMGPKHQAFIKPAKRTMEEISIMYHRGNVFSKCHI